MANPKGIFFRDVDGVTPIEIYEEIKGQNIVGPSGFTVTKEDGTVLLDSTKLGATPLSTSAPATNDILQYDGTKWGPAIVSGISNYNVRYTTDYIWSKTGEAGFGALTAGVQATITVASAPKGIDCSNSTHSEYWIYISGVGTAEAVKVTGGTATPGNSGTIIFTPANSHATGYTIGTATAGIQEALNDADTLCKVVIPPSATPYVIYGKITMYKQESQLIGYGATLDHQVRGICLQVGDLLSSTNANTNIISGLTFRNYNNTKLSSAEYAGSKITTTVRASGVSTITTSAAHGFKVGDPVTILFTDDTRYWGDVPKIASVPSSTTFTYDSTGRSDAASQTTPGVVALTYVCILDNANDTHFVDIKLDELNNYGKFNGVFHIWDDENCVIDNFCNNGCGLNCNVNWTPSYIASYGASNIPNASQQLAAVLNIRNSSLTCQDANGVTVFNCNGLYVDNTIVQASGPWQFNVSNALGNYQGAAFRNIYSESTEGANPSGSPKSPWPGCGIAGLIAGPSTSAASFTIAGQGLFTGDYHTVGSSGTSYVYYVVAHDTTNSTVTAPLPCMFAQSSGGSVIVSWPRIANGTDTITYDVLRVPSSSITSIDWVGPYSGGCPGGSVSAFGSVVVGQAQQSGFVQTFTDDTTVATTNYPTVSEGTYTGNLTFWPGQCIAVNTPVISDIPLAVFGTGLRGTATNVARFATVGGTAFPNVLSTAATQWDAGNSIRNHQALLLNDGTNAGGNLSPDTKGRLNFQTSGITSITSGHIVTLVDSNPMKTRGYALNRPPNDANDMYIGQDAQGGVAISAAQMALGSPVAISSYIANIGDNTSWLERLTATLKTFKVPVVLKTGTPASSGAAGVTGQIAWDSSYIYICTATNTWKRVAITTW